jgi:hypothetical protein
MATSIFHVTLGDEDLGTFDIQDLSNSDAYLIENVFNLTTKGFIDGIQEMRASAVDALLWLMYRRQGKTVDRAVIRWTIGSLKVEPEPDPTVASDGSDGAATSDSSPTSAI